MFGKFAPALNSAVCWKLLYYEIIIDNIRQSARNLLLFSMSGIFRDYTPQILCYEYFAKSILYVIPIVLKSKNYLNLNLNKFKFFYSFSTLNLDTKSKYNPLF